MFLFLFWLFRLFCYFRLALLCEVLFLFVYRISLYIFCCMFFSSLFILCSCHFCSFLSFPLYFEVIITYVRVRFWYSRFLFSLQYVLYVLLFFTFLHLQQNLCPFGHNLSIALRICAFHRANMGRQIWGGHVRRGGR